MKILTCNILSSECDCESEYEWPRRSGYCMEQIRAQQPDIFGLQECSDEQYADFVAAFPEFGDTSGPAATALVEPLSKRELEVLALIAEGLSNQEIADHLVISLSTVKGHTTNIYGKLGTHRRTQAAAKAKELGLL